MFVRRNFLVVASLVSAVGLAGCMTYDFEPVQPLAVAQTSQPFRVVAKQLKPNVMLLLDKSGSMNQPIGTGTRLSEMKAAMNTFLGSSGSLARYGLMTYPNTNVDECAASGVGDILQPLPAGLDDTDSKLQDLANNVRNSIQNVTAGGGTPTGGSLRNLGTYSSLLGDEREDFILLLTDGLPNCNAQNVNSYSANPTACRCTLTTGTPPNTQPACIQAGNANYDRSGCLDKDNSVQAISELNAKKIRTIVIGFAAELASGDGEEVLNAMAEAGGFPRTCPMGTNAECGSNNACVNNQCQKKFYQTGNAAELAAALEKIARDVTVTDPCLYRLASTPSDPRFLAVLIDGSPIATAADTWQYAVSNGTPTVRFTQNGAICSRLTNATPQSPVQLEFRIVETL